jgi:hypothetical protein
VQDLKTVGDLVRFLLETRPRSTDAVQPPTPSPRPCGRPSKRPKLSEEATVFAEEPCRWSPKRLEHVQQVVLNALLESGKK